MSVGDSTRRRAPSIVALRAEVARIRRRYEAPSAVITSPGKAAKAAPDVAADRFVTGVSFADGDLWHGTWEDETSELRRVDPATDAAGMTDPRDAGHS